MPALEISIDSLAETIKKLNKIDLETLTLLLTDEGNELLKRKDDIVNNKIKTLSRDEVFDVWKKREFI